MDSFVAPKKRVPTKLNTPLAHSFGFDFGDLQDNRTGFISHWQKKRLRWYLLSYSISILIWIALTSIFPLWLVLDAGRVTSLATLSIGLILAVFGVFWLWKIRSVYLDLQRGKVAELISSVKHVREVHSRRARHGTKVSQYNEMHYFLRIANERFIATQEQMQAFREGVLYHIYVAPESRQILSAELVKEGEMDEIAAFLYGDEHSNEDFMLFSDDILHTSTKEKH